MGPAKGDIVTLASVFGALEGLSKWGPVKDGIEIVSRNFLKEFMNGNIESLLRYTSCVGQPGNPKLQLKFR